MIFFLYSEIQYVKRYGKLNDDKGIYIVNQNKKGEYERTGQKLGNSMTENSFFGDNGKVVKGAVINPNDQSGQRFIDSEIKGKTHNIVIYAIKARNGEKYEYDFKDRNIKKRGDQTKDQYRYRGMPVENSNGETEYASGRDIGNYGARYVAGKNGLRWNVARLGFDLYQSYKNGQWSVEGQTTQKAERAGYDAGIRIYFGTKKK